MSDDKPREACGIVGISSTDQVVNPLLSALRVLQHRGQESAGIAVFSDHMRMRKAMGLVTEVFSDLMPKYLRGCCGIGHVRYSTTGDSNPVNAQPFAVHGSYGSLALGHNGNLVNTIEIREKLEQHGTHFQTTSDTEAMTLLLARRLSEMKEPIAAIRALMREMRGSYSLVILLNERVFGVRDPHAIKPLQIGRIDGAYMMASESCVFDYFQGEVIRDVRPGEIIELTHDGFEAHETFSAPQPAHCMFEWVYFARPDSVMDGVLTYDVRYRIGEILAERTSVEADLVIPVPDSGRAHAAGYAERAHLPYVEGLIKNRFIDRTFIQPDQLTREQEVRLKLNPLTRRVKGQRLVLVDDSIVRGTTMKAIVRVLRAVGAKEIHIRIGCPPIRHPCFLGINMKTRSEMLAPGKGEEEIAATLGADSVRYIPIDGLVEAIGKDHAELCLGCLEGKYPVLKAGETVRGPEDLGFYPGTA